MKEKLEVLLLPYYYFRNPPKFNYWLNKYECSRGFTKLRSYPQDVGINISNICNQVCLFCCHDNRKMNGNNWLEPKLFERMKWLKYVSTIWLFAGTGDPLVNPHFPQIARIVRKLAPHSKIAIFTNGLALEGDNLEAILETHDILHISLNAVKRETYDSIIKGNYNQVMKNIEELGKRKTSSLFVELSLILMHRTLRDIFPMIELASQLKFQRVIVSRFVMATSSSERFGKEEMVSIEESANEMEKLQSEAKSKGIDFIYSMNNNSPKLCYEPWRVAYFTNYEVGGGRWFLVCCDGILNIEVGLKGYQNFKKIWNCERIQNIRKTVNLPLPQQNRMCEMCRTIDREKANWKEEVLHSVFQRQYID